VIGGTFGFFLNHPNISRPSNVGENPPPTPAAQDRRELQAKGKTARTKPHRKQWATRGDAINFPC
jgi:hypothetical protein